MPSRSVACRSLVVLAGILALAGSDVSAESPNTVNWRTDLAAARAESLATCRPLWVQFTGPWCPGCRRMEAESFVHPSIARLSGSFVPVKLRSDEHEEYALGFGLSALPATVLLRPDGSVISVSQGYRTPSAFQTLLASAVNSTPAREIPPAPAQPSALLALEGFCPVSLVDGHRLVAGQPQVKVEHEGRVFRFADSAGREAFLQAPARYTPTSGGYCAVARVDRGESPDGSPRFGVLYDGHLYLCASKAERTRFLANPERYAHVDLPIRSNCPHCWAVEDGLVRSRKHPLLARAQKKYRTPELARGNLDARSGDSIRR